MPHSSNPLRRRGRPRSRAGPLRYPNRLAELRERLGLTQEEIAAAAAISPSYYGELERGMRRLNADLAQRLHGVLRCLPGDLLGSDASPSVPLQVVVAGAFAERPDRFELPEPYLMLPAPRRLAEPEACVAAEVADDSADLDYPAGSTLFIRKVAAGGDTLPLGSKVVVRFERQAAAGGLGPPATHEVLYGRLALGAAGDLLLSTRSRSREIPKNLTIRPAAPRRGLEEHDAAAAPRQATVDYLATDGDEAVILGTVVFSWRPE
jgi:transcriptional regulator with XRE-family HTH domain